MADNISSPAELLPLEKERFRVAYQHYFKLKRGNFFRSVTVFQGLWDALQLLNDIWMREFSDLEQLRDQFQLLPKLLFSAAHARFLTAIELGFSCCIGDAYSVPRDGIEATTHVHKIFMEPATASAWSDKHKGKVEETAYKKTFEEKKKENLFPEQHGLRKLQPTMQNSLKWPPTRQLYRWERALKTHQCQETCAGRSIILRQTRKDWPYF
jgi:hypothetical protein